ncbi:nuclear transport factor 2 family protein [Mycobacterium sp. 3519A]|uniref:nuclear transport factor 2 family protein n=1 Tax=Mycobacterium sp. 3519A TaxID=2057184 RepID=UPI00135C7B94|nr:nuclear transport factor 2 family protein [Mycobacterium sp. 3519A]
MTPPDRRKRMVLMAERRAAVVLGTAVLLAAGTTPVANAAEPPEAAAVELLKATYFNDVDTKNWLALRQLFAPDAVVDTTGSFGPYFPNRDSFIAFTSLTLSAINTRHQGYDPQIEVTSDTTASAVWTMQDRLSVAGLVTIHGYGHYTDRYEEVDGQWRITYSKLTRTGFAVEFPAFQKFLTGLNDAFRAGGPVAAVAYVGPAVVDIPVSAAKQLVGAIASNFGGPPAKAEPITVPRGSTGVTTEPPGVTTVPSAPPKKPSRSSKPSVAKDNDAAPSSTGKKARTATKQQGAGHKRAEHTKAGAKSERGAR